MGQQSIHETFQGQFQEANRKPPVSFGLRDKILFVLSAIGLIIALLSTSTTNFVPLLGLRDLEKVFRHDFHIEPTETNTGSEQDIITNTHEIPSWGKMTKLASSDKYLCFYDSMHLVLMSKESLDSWGDYKSYFTNTRVFDNAFFVWLQEQFPHGYTTFRAQIEGSVVSKIQGSTARISSVRLTDTHLIILYDNWGVEFYAIATTRDSFRMNLLWFKSLLRPADDFREKKIPVEYFFSRPREVTIHFLDHAVHEGDQGLIVIGARSQTRLQKLTRADILSRADELDQDRVIYTYLSDQGIDEETKIHGKASDAHYSYFGVELQSGEIRWRHEADDFQYTHKEVLHPQHSFKVETEQETFHTGEVHWRNYVEDILAKGTPHLHRHDEDTKIIPAHFKPSSKRYSTRSKQEKDYGLIGNKLHNVISSYSASKKALATTDEIPNVLVVHLGVGIEVIHIYSGRTLCQLTPLKKNVAYGELNSDGSINSAQVVTRRGANAITATDCIAEIESGNKGNSEIVFQTSVCSMQQTWRKKSSLIHILKQHYDQQDEAPVSAVAPVILKRFNSIRNKIEYDVIFLASSGLATCITNDDGKWKLRWQVETRSSWSTSDPDLSNESGSFFPHISLYRVNENSFDKNILLVGREVLTVLDLKGNILQSIPLPKQPVIAPIKYLDADDDGKLDIQVETQNAVYLFSSKQKPGSSQITFILFSLMAILGIMYLSTNIDVSDSLFYRYRSQKNDE